MAKDKFVTKNVNTNVNKEEIKMEKHIYSPGPIDDAQVWTDEDYEAYFEYCEVCEKKEKEKAKNNTKEENKMTHKLLEESLKNVVSGKHVEKTPMFELMEEKKMERHNTKKIVNAEVTNDKEEKTMTKATSIADLRKQIQAEQEAITGESFDRGSQAPDKFANKDNVGMQNVPLKSVDMISIKFPAKEDKAPSFARALQLTIDDDTKANINWKPFLYDAKGKVDGVDVYDAITNGAGTKGVYLTVKPDAEEKDAEELTADDLEIHELKKDERIWIPAKKELRALAQQLGVSEITFDDDEHAEIPALDNILVYVYEDAVDIHVMKAKGKDVAEYKETKFYYNVSFIAPEDQHNMKYGRRFTTSKDANHRAELAELPGVIRYLESC